MTDFYVCRKTGGFYATDVHGTRTMLVPDPTWVRPVDLVPDPSWQPSPDNPAAPCPLVELPDMSVSHPLIEVSNPACTLPAADRLIAIDAATHDALMRQQSAGMQIAFDGDGRPVAVAPPKPTTAQQASAYRGQRDVLLDEVTARLQRHMLQKAFGQATTLTDSQASDLAAYAQALRDVPQQPNFPDTVAWPVPPAFSDANPTPEASP